MVNRIVGWFVRVNTKISFATSIARKNETWYTNIWQSKPQMPMTPFVVVCIDDKGMDIYANDDVECDRWSHMSLRIDSGRGNIPDNRKRFREYVIAIMKQCHSRETSNRCDFRQSCHSLCFFCGKVESMKGRGIQEGRTWKRFEPILTH